MRAIFLYLSMIVFICIPVFSESGVFPHSSELLPAMSAEARSALKADGLVFRYDEEQLGPQFLPEGTSLSDWKRRTGSDEPEVMVEALYSIPYPEGFADSPEAVIKKLYRLSHRVSSFDGVKYFSVRRQDYAVLFTDAYAVDSLEGKRRIADPVPAEDELSGSLIMHMNENALGSGYYRMNYRGSEQYLEIDLQNLTSMGFIITAVKEGGMNIYLRIIPCSDSLLIYGYSGVVLENDPLVHLMLNPYYAFFRRMTAMETWLYNLIHQTDLLPPLADPQP